MSAKKRAGLSARTASVQAAMTAAKDTPPEQVPAKSKPVGLTLRLDPAVHDQLRTIAFNERTSIQALLSEAVQAVIAKRG